MKYEEATEELTPHVEIKPSGIEWIAEIPGALEI